MTETVFLAAQRCLAARAPDHKIERTQQAAAAWRAGSLALAPAPGPEPIAEPGRPRRPALVHPRHVPRRGINAPAGRAALLHAIAHIECNAINLAWDAVDRGRELPRDFDENGIHVAQEEGQHFSLLRDRLRQLEHDYGDFPAHDGLWEMAMKTAHDPLLRMALVPRLLEARGLDVTPGMIARLEQCGDEQSVAILRIILRDEIGHVAIGSRWFKYLCAQRNLEPETTFRALVRTYTGRSIPGPLNREARRRAGFSETELAAIES